MGLNSESSLNTVDLVTSWKTCCVIVWSVAAETSSFSGLFWLNKTSHLTKPSKMAWALEMAAQKVRNLHQNTSHSVHAVHSRDAACTKAHSQKEQSPCYHCGRKYLSTACKFKTATCYYCHKQGHITTICHSKIRDTKKKTPLTKSTHQLQAEDNTQYTMYYRSCNDPIWSRLLRLMSTMLWRQTWELLFW